MRSVRPSQLAASVSVQGRSRASKADREGSSLPRIQRQGGWLNVGCYACQTADGTRISGRRASDVCDFTGYRFGASQIPDCDRGYVQITWIQRVAGVLQCSASALANARTVARAAKEGEPI